MDVKSLTGSSIQAALTDARRQFGDRAVLVESTPPAGGEPARVTVMVDPAPAEASQPRSPKQAAQKSSPRLPSAADGAARPGASAAPPAASKEAAPSSGFGYALASARQEKTGRGRLFPKAGREESSRNTAPGASTREKLLESKLHRLNDRLDRMEQQFGTTGMEADERWTAHPLFAALRKQGLHADTLHVLFGELAEHGHAPESSDRETLQWAMAQLLKRRLQGPSLKPSTDPLALVGPSGAGTTSLLLQLATHRSFYARRQPAVIIVAPEEDDTAYQNPMNLYRRFGLPVQTVRTEEEMARALERTEPFGQILIDTPPVPLSLERARPPLRRLERLLGGLMPLEVHFALSATRTLRDVDAAAFERMPLAPSAVALTHLDEAPHWGHVAEWLMEQSLPVGYVSDSRQVPEGARSFSATWFVEEMMGL